MDDCIFCKISKGELPCFKIWEDDEFLSFLDIKPVTEGMTLVISKDHKDSKMTNNSDIDLSEIIVASKKVAKLLEEALNLERVAIILEGLEVGHLHIKLIPIREGENIKTILNSNYPQSTMEELEDLSLSIGKN